MIIGWPLRIDIFYLEWKSKMVISRVFKIGPYGKMNKSFFLRNNKHGWTQLYMKPFDGTFKSWHLFFSEIQDGRHRRTSWQIVGSNLRRVKPKTIELVFATSLLSMQHEGVRAKTSTDWLWIRIMCQWSNMSTHESLFQWASTLKFPAKHVGPV